MAPASFGDSEDDLISNRGNRANGYDIVYTRRNVKKSKKVPEDDGENPGRVIPSVSDTVGASDSASELQEKVQHEQRSPSLKNDGFPQRNGVEIGNALTGKQNGKRPKVLKKGNLIENDAPDGIDIGLSQAPHQKGSLNEELVPSSTAGAQGEGLADGKQCEEPLAISSSGDMISFKLSRRSSKAEIEHLNHRLENNLESIRRTLKQFEVREHELVSSISQQSNNKFTTNGSFKGSEALNNDNFFQGQSHARPELSHRRLFLRVNPETGPAVKHEGQAIGLSRVSSDVGIQRNPAPRTFNRQLSVAVMETNHGQGEHAEKEKRTPKANQFYRNSEFILAKDRLPPESNKRLKAGSGKNSEQAFRVGFGFDKGRNQCFKNGSSLLQRLMKHKFGWVFNTPVDAEHLGLVDYHDIIKHPMDLGTIKGRLAKNWYKYPTDFAEDVRLVFRNAMTYNPKGQDVHIMAEQLLQIFEERWAVIEAEYNDYCRYQLYKEGVRPSNSSKSAPIQPYTYAPFSSHNPDAPQNRPFDRREPFSTSVAGDPRTPRSSYSRVPAPKKPKAKDLNKRDMTQDEKQKLSKHLQDLPMEKLDAIVQIIKKRNTTVSQHDDEIEVDIDSVDPETLWELDRFVSNYKKRLSKNKRKAELAQAKTTADQSAVATSAPAITSVQTENGVFEKSVTPAEGEKTEANNNSSSSSYSSDSGSSSSDSDTSSSSGDGSDAGDSPKT